MFGARMCYTLAQSLVTPLYPRVVYVFVTHRSLLVEFDQS